jgi:CubicO group peptidase (beta-lactamase class C family)
MQIKSSSFFLFLFFLFLTCIDTAAQTKKSFIENRKNQDYTALIDGLDSLIKKKMADYNIFGVSIAIVDDQTMVWAKGFGYTDKTKIQQVDNFTLFSTQSISKTFLATAFLMEVEKGKYNLDDAIIKFYPSFSIRSRYDDNEAKKITFRQLLSHRAGFSQEAPVGNNYDTLHCTFEEHIKSMGSSWLRFPVGKFYSYSNMGPDIVGYILSKRAGEGVEEYLNQSLLKPLGMTTSTYNQEEVYKSGNYAKGYFGNKEMEKTYIGDLAAGGLYSNPTDMAKFLSFQFNNCKINGKVIISPELINQMYTVQFKIHEQAAGYGLGVRLKPYHGGTLAHHAGGGYGYRGEQAWIPEAKIGVIILTNDGAGSSFTNEIYQKALEGMIKAKFGSLAETEVKKINKPIIQLKKTYLKTLAGTYKTNRSILEIVAVNNNIAAVLGTDTSFLIAHSNTEFSDIDGQRFIFSFDKKRMPTHFININQNNADFYIFNDFRGEKWGENKLSWNALVGSYKGYNNRQEEIIELFIKNGYLYCSDGGPTKITEYKPGIFFTADGELIIKKGNVLYFGNKVFYETVK